MPLGTVTTAKDTSGNRTVSYRDAFGRSYNAKVEKMSSQATAMAAPTTSTNTSGGTLPAATYTYRVTKIIDDVESLVSSASAGQATTGSTSTVTVNWVNDANAQAYRVYGRSGTEQFIAQVAAGTTSYIDTGAITPSGAQPGALAATAVHLRIPSLKGQFQMLKGGVLPATAEGQLNRYYVR